uniref:Uncharacterized protein n=1 Tax=Rangifer tarandus platyrhynchus TaxID=3082113 RepID=A0ACB0F6Y9_RANTA|nr:unnamed protein product [Rangifer tarandus platyrhynchus]
MAYRVRPAALATVQDQRELGSGDLATRLCVGLIPKVDTQASLGCQAGLEKGSEAFPGAAPTLVGRGHGLVTPGQVAGPQEPHLSSGPSLVLSGSGVSAGPLLLPSGFPLCGAASTRVTGQPSCWPRRR